MSHNGMASIKLRILVRFPTEIIQFSLLRGTQTGCEAYLSLNFGVMDIQGSAVKVTIHPVQCRG